MREIYILCGIPGSGKTTLANKLYNAAKTDGKNPTILCRDEYRKAVLEDILWGKMQGQEVDVPSWRFEFDIPLADMLEQAYQQSFRQGKLDRYIRKGFERLIMKELILNDHDPIIIDSTHTGLVDIMNLRRIIGLADPVFNKKVFHCKGCHKSEHNVPIETMKRFISEEECNLKYLREICDEFIEVK